MTAILVKPGKYESLPAELEGHEVDAEKQREYPSLGRHYRVLLDGAVVGSITGHKEMQHVVHRRIRHDTGYRMQWRGYAASEIGAGKAIGYPRDSRSAAAHAVAQLWMQESHR